MPPKQALSEAKQNHIRVWIEQGAAETVCTDTTTTNGSTGGGETTWHAPVFLAAGYIACCIVLHFATIGLSRMLIT